MAKSLGCYGCVPPERHLNCHSSCDKYAEYRDELDKSKPDTDKDYLAYHVDRINKSKKRR